ncbi:MAG: flagellar basal-body rod protein FlgF [Bacillota bacterium]|nr:flagellar basal-body rod protein FlgF [Bacillota bacterium]
MLRGMYAGISGLRIHQTKMDVIGNNIANVNTVGFKKSRVTFQEIMSQTIKEGSAPQNNKGGTNPLQVGLGLGLGSIDVIHAPGNTQTTGRITDLAIEGDGFFLVKAGEEVLYTRAGTFAFDRDGSLLNADGMKVQGWLPDQVTGIIDDTNPGIDALSDLRINIGGESGAKVTDSMVLTNNLSSEVAPGTMAYAPIEVYDQNGRSYQMEVIFTKGDNVDEWTYSARVKVGDAYQDTLNDINLVFDPTGKEPIDGGNSELTFTDIAGNEVTINIDLTKITQYSAPTTIQVDSQNGYQSGTLESVSVDATGVIYGIYSNGMSKQLGKVALATFKNPAGLVSQGGNLFRTTNNSGIAQIGASGTGGRGSILPGSLEMSNVDLSEEFVDMIATQRGFQANSRIISTSDEMLQELTNMKR